MINDQGPARRGSGRAEFPAPRDSRDRRKAVVLSSGGRGAQSRAPASAPQCVNRVPYTGPFTLVPLPGRQSSLVCVETAEGAQRLLTMSTSELELELERRAHSILGWFKLASKAQSFPLAGLTATRLTADRLALVGETAHVFPPIGAQGLNLSLRDISDLGNVLSKALARNQDIGSSAVLAGYETRRRSDIRSRTNAVDALNRSLLTGFLPVQLARGAGMYFAGKVGPLRRLLMREGMAPGAGFELFR
ncbi:FAD-dependent monooxygenase [Roseibium salinum]|uniref:FAD-dependent monooxygenase n=1 Tax=Roseibium salinum TaxID=1604349 RepID=UPI0036091181